MDPLVVSGLLSLGSKVVNNLFDGQPARRPAPEAFSVEKTTANAAAAATEKSSELAAWLSLNGVHSLQDLGNQLGQIQQQLVQDPAVARFAAQAQGPLSLSVEQGALSLRDASGRQLTLAPDSSAHQLARRLDQLGNLAAAGQAAPGADLVQLAGVLGQGASHQAVWPLGFGTPGA